MNINHPLQNEQSINEDQELQNINDTVMTPTAVSSAATSAAQYNPLSQLGIPTSSLPNVSSTSAAELSFSQLQHRSSSSASGSSFGGQQAHQQQTFGTASYIPQHHQMEANNSQPIASGIPPFLDPNRRISSDDSSSSTSYVQLARRRRSSKSKEKQQRKTSSVARPQGRPLSKETRVRLTLVPTLGILYSILVSDTVRKSLKVLKYSNDADSMMLTNEELSTRNVISGFSSLLNVRTARFSEDGSYSPNKTSNIPKFNSIDEAVSNLFGLTNYTLIRVSRAAATEVGGSVLLKIETAMPGYSHLNDDEDEDLKTVEENKIYLEAIGSKGDRPSTIFLKKKVARPRYKSDMRIYLIPRINSCAIYCEKRMFKRDLLRGFLDMEKLDRSVIVAFDYQEALDELRQEGHEDMIKQMNLPTVEEFNASSHLPNVPDMDPSSVELSISKQSEFQHLQHIQSHQQHQQQHQQQQQQYEQQQHQQHISNSLEEEQLMTAAHPQIPLQHQLQQHQQSHQPQDQYIPPYFPRPTYEQPSQQQLPQGGVPNQQFGMGQMPGSMYPFPQHAQQMMPNQPFLPQHQFIPPQQQQQQQQQSQQQQFNQYPPFPHDLQQQQNPLPQAQNSFDFGPPVQQNNPNQPQQHQQQAQPQMGSNYNQQMYPQQNMPYFPPPNQDPNNQFY